MLKKSSLIPLLLFPVLASAQQCNETYVGVFGGGGYSNFGNMTQSGTAFFVPEAGGALNVHATGSANNKPAYIVGINAGYRWNGWAFCAGGNPWCASPAAEFEGYYLNSKTNGQVTDLNNRLLVHTFRNSFNIDTGVLLANNVWTFRTPCLCLQPYIGVGIGAAIVSVYNADSLQIVPPEPGVNHYNSGNNDTTWTFAAQAKAGLRYEFAKNWRVFAEYRYVYLAPTSYRFGTTQYPTHASTSKWGLRMDSTGYNLGSLGIEYAF